MKKAFYGSLCYQGIRGGAILMNDEAVLYKNQTLTLPDEYKNIKMPYKNIKKVTKESYLLFPAVTIYLKDGHNYKFIIFNRKRFFKELQPLI